ncbi:uncharacterized protein LOC132278264 [Cornus florida]|uniref:uncharacterized protein LOC132278264 n=1 Tax=Cornus florida TaxID=4283 RepID=UPI00289CB5FB|nr:uncharacterized protein LOC132278264 [Cornus florida]
MAATTSFIIFIIMMSVVATTNSLPFVVFHGIADNCTDKVSIITQKLTNWSGSEGYCIEIGDGYNSSIYMPLMNQTTIACEKVKSMSELNDGYNIVAISQGNMVARGLIEFCDEAPPVKNYVSFAGPQAGVASPPCSEPEVCSKLDTLIEQLGVYSQFVQEHLAPAGYIKIPDDIPDYLRGSEFLPKLNNELAICRNSAYKERFASLDNLVLIMCDQDEVLVPKETSWFGFYPEGPGWANSTVLPANETMLYKENWIGLKTLVEAGKVQFVNVSGRHVEISDSDIIKYIVPYLNGSVTLSMVESSSSSI